MIRHVFPIAAAGVCLGGCHQAPRGFESPEPGERVHAVVDAARRHDETTIPRLITLLRSDDPLVRMTTIRTLELLTGQTLGYDHAGPEPLREEAVERWVRWFEEQAPGRRPAVPGAAQPPALPDASTGLPGDLR